MTASTSIPQRPSSPVCDGCTDRFCLANAMSGCSPLRSTSRPSDHYPSNAAEFKVRTHITNQPPNATRGNGLAKAA